MRIAYIINSVEGGGAAAPVPAVVRVLSDAGCKVMVFALSARDGRSLPPMLDAGIEVRVRAGGGHDHSAAWRWLDNEVARFGPTHLWTSLTRATLLGQLVGVRRRVPVVSWQHNAFLKPANLWLLRAMAGLSGLWIGDSATVTALTAERLRIPRDRLATWPLFAAREDRPQMRPWRPGETLRLGSLGRLHRNKGYDVLIDAIAHLQARGFTPPVPFAVTVAGDGDERKALEARAGAAGVASVSFAGFTDRPADFLAGLHLYVQPSRSEGLCIAAHEAMLAGLPVIASAVGEMAHSVVPHVTGALVPPGDPIALADALAALLGNPSSLHSISRVARERVLELFGELAFAQAGQAIVTRIASLKPARL